MECFQEISGFKILPKIIFQLIKPRSYENISKIYKIRQIMLIYNKNLFIYGVPVFLNIVEHPFI